MNVKASTIEEFAKRVWWELPSGETILFSKTADFAKPDKFVVTSSHIGGKSQFTANAYCGGKLFTCDTFAGKITEEKFIEIFSQYLCDAGFKEAVYSVSALSEIPSKRGYVSLMVEQFAHRVVSFPGEAETFSFRISPSHKIRYTAYRMKLGTRTCLICANTDPNGSTKWFEYDRYDSCSVEETVAAFSDYLESVGFGASVILRVH